MSAPDPRRPLAAALCLLAVAASLASPAPPNPTLRIGLRLGTQSVRVSGEGSFQFLGPSGRPLATGQAQEVWRVWAIPEWVWSAPGRAPLRPQAGDEVFLISPCGRAVAASPLPLTVRPRSGHLVALDCAADHWDRIATRSYRGDFEICQGARGGTLSLVNLVDLESYLQGVVPSEMSQGYPLEALKAQAVAARTECLSCLRRHLVDGADMCNTQHCQVYGGVTSEAATTTAAVEATRGLVLTYQGALARCVYAAVCGGHTENNNDVWPVPPLPYLRGQPDFDPAQHPQLQFPLDQASLAAYLEGPLAAYCCQPQWSKPEYYRWRVEVDRAELERRLAATGVQVGSVTALTPLARGVSGRIKSLQVRGTAGEATLGPELAIRRALGSLRSSDFLVTWTTAPDGLPARFTFVGAGWGHGVGMCQVGAVGLAAAGADFRAILARYFPGTSLCPRWQIRQGRFSAS